MQPPDFHDDRAGRLVKTPEDYWAFVPHPLPPPLDWSNELVETLSSADRAVGQLSGTGQTLNNPYLLIRPFMQREAVLSSRIEGTQSSLSDLFLFEAKPTAEHSGSDVQEVANYVHALEYGLERLQEFPLSLRFIRELHGKLMQGVRGEGMTPGEFRKSQNWIGPPGCSLNEATHVPPPPFEMIEALGEFERYIRTPDRTPPLVRLALIHYQFEAIHPFLDGNGRIGRLLMTLLQCIEGILPQPLLYLSAYFEKHRTEYYDHLLAVSRSGRWVDWINFFLRGVSEQALDAVRRSNDLLRLRETFHGRFHEARSSALLLKLIDRLFSYPATTVGWTAEHLGVTRKSARLSIDKLVAEGVLEEVTARKRDRVYVAREIVEALEAPEAPEQ